MSNAKPVLFKITLALTIFTVLTCIVISVLIPDADGVIIDESFINQLRTWYIMGQIRDISLYTCFFWGAAAFVIRISIWAEEERAFSNSMLVCYFIFVAIVFILIAVKIPTTLPAITNKPVVESVTVVNKDTDYGGGKFSKGLYYTLYFSNGTYRGVSKEKYNNTEIGDPFYVVTCGKIVLRSFDGKECRLGTV